MWQACHDDGQENSIGLDGCRPTINAVMFGEARALARIAALLGRAEAARLYSAQAERWRTAVESLWSAELRFFVTRAYPPPSGRREDVRLRRTKLGCLMCPRRQRERCPPAWADGELVDVRELMGLTSPFMFGAARAQHAVAFEQLHAPGGFGARWGYRIAERRHRCYNFSSDCVTSWHAALWPFEVAKLGKALIAALTGPLVEAVRPYLQPSHFGDYLLQYTRMHTRGRAEEVPAGSPFIGESFHPDDGYWLTRRLLFRGRHGDRRRGDHYFHSSFADLVLSGLVGVRIDDEPPGGGAAAAATLVVQPLFAPQQLPWFRVERLLLRGREVAIAWDADGTKYGRGAGLAVWVDGERVGCAEALEPLVLRGVLQAGGDARRSRPGEAEPRPYYLMYHP